VVAYRTVAAPGAAEALAAALADGFDLALFASPSAVENVAALLGERARDLPSAVIGPVTEQAARAAGLDVRVVAEPSTAAGLVAGLARLYAAAGAAGA
jgi:uroporphyrinogen-III synthase